MLLMFQGREAGGGCGGPEMATKGGEKEGGEDKGTNSSKTKFCHLIFLNALPGQTVVFLVPPNLPI